MLHILSHSKFVLGEVVITANAREQLTRQEIQTGLTRHAQADWGDLCPEDMAFNDEALHDGGRLFSAYGQGTRRFWIITEADGSVTTILMPEDY